MTNAAGECEFANDRACEPTGSTAKQSLGFGWMIALHPDDAERVTVARGEAAPAGRDVTLEYRCCRPDGSGFHSALLPSGV